MLPPDYAKFASTTSGFVNGDIFFEWFETVFSDYVKSKDSVTSRQKLQGY
jgi:hypothetical protein